MKMEQRLGRIVLGVLVFIFCVELANFTGFSWDHFRRLSDEELARIAVQYEYPGVYSSYDDFKYDYSAFVPKVYYWTDLIGDVESLYLNKFFGLTRFHVRLPEAVVVVSKDGEPIYSRRCSDGNWCSPTIAPDRPKLGIVGTVQSGPPNYAVANDISVNWIKGSEGTVFISGHCFAAFSDSMKPILEIRGANGRAMAEIGDQYGFRIVVIKEPAVYSALKVSEQLFKESRTCDPSVRAAWPNVGGASWIR